MAPHYLKVMGKQVYIPESIFPDEKREQN